MNNPRTAIGNTNKKDVIFSALCAKISPRVFVKIKQKICPPSKEAIGKMLIIAKNKFSTAKYAAVAHNENLKIATLARATITLNAKPADKTKILHKESSSFRL